MWMNGSRSRRSTPANARRTGKPSPSCPDGAVVTDRTVRSTACGPGGEIRGSVVTSATVMAGIAAPPFFVDHSTTYLNAWRTPRIPAYLGAPDRDRADL